ncbi:hydrogenase, EchA subunit [Nautilia profundicola AmH]|uniref:Hydrogenase, EchA subunit n=1 Tax=Nautilia profundicola (strain ATCC BAA-1463 / DSM 18972 / AmH) TaxID=598659 RepID=B9L8T8_NAUPA|nr:proton-conducting transporter membrane subunit [Nautilia profundicola]ACM92256.1 hydrogenase, EchA subunit [Nautilia profundicola AmH]
MDLFITMSIVLPWIAAFVIYLAKNDFLTNVLSFAMLPILGYFAWMVYSSGNLPYLMDTPSWVNYLITVYDFGLLGYFLYQGIKNKSMLVSALAILQLVLLIIVVLMIEHSNTANIYVDKLTAFMYMIVAIVGVPIAIFATKYMEYDEKGKHSFVAILIWFLGVMNFAVSVNNIEWFFALFETTTLASYVLIRFRMDREAVNNAILALWMNQIGGVAILFALLTFIKTSGMYHFTDLLNADPKTLSLAALGFLSLSALVKGAQMPFHKWLLGAMVAPTPVSAILHSATMVKIAPYLLLRISPIIKGTLLAKLLIITTGFVFVAAAVIALTQDNFKKILAYSTISLLGLMMLAAVVGTPIAITASLLLILFHAFAKGFLFIEAGVLEKVFHVKYIKEMRRLIERAPLTLMFIFFGFLNMTFVPFGTFIGKWIMIEEASGFLTHGSYVLLILYVGAGSAFLSVLYMKVLGISVRKSHGIEKVKLLPLPKRFNFVSIWYYAWLLALTVFIAPFIATQIVPIATELSGSVANIHADNLSLVINSSTLYFWQIMGALVILLLIHALPFFVHFKNVDTAMPYNCGEAFPRHIETYNFVCISKYENYLIAFSIALFVMVLVLGGGLL